MGEVIATAQNVKRWKAKKFSSNWAIISQVMQPLQHNVIRAYYFGEIIYGWNENSMIGASVSNGCMQMSHWDVEHHSMVLICTTVMSDVPRDFTVKYWNKNHPIITRYVAWSVLEYGQRTLTMGVDSSIIGEMTVRLWLRVFWWNRTSDVPIMIRNWLKKHY